jgi:hypothetical protein
MPNALQHYNDDRSGPVGTGILRYTGEDDGSFLVSNPDGVCLNVPKNRSVPQPFPDQPTRPLTPVFRLLLLAFVGLAPAGLGAIILAPLAALWALVLLITRHLSPGDQKRVMVICGIAIFLLVLAIPMSRLFLTRQSL